MIAIGTAALAAVVLVHGGFVDGSGWEDVYKILKRGWLQGEHRPEPDVNTCR